jgi:uroporphyrinogen decarboxylase
MTVNTKFHRTCLGEIQEKPPVWMMRQAGRYLPEYLDIRKNFPDFMEFCFTPDSVTEVTLQPINRFNFDAAIIFSDILVIPHAIGQDVWFEKNYGPKLKSLPIFESWNKNWIEKLRPIYDAIKTTRLKLSKDKSLIGFAATPWTLGAYMLCQNKIGTEQNLYAAINKHTGLLNPLLDKLVPIVAEHLINQVNAGCDVVQLFDSWASFCKTDEQENNLIAPFMKILKLFWKIHPNTPVIYYGKEVSHLYKNISERANGPLVLGYDQFININVVNSVNNPSQGNLDPEVLIEGGKALDTAVNIILETTKKRPHIFNLGHGIKPETPIKHVERMLQLVRD